MTARRGTQRTRQRFKRYHGLILLLLYAVEEADKIIVLVKKLGVALPKLVEGIQQLAATVTVPSFGTPGWASIAHGVLVSISLVRYRALPRSRGRALWLYFLASTGMYYATLFFARAEGSTAIGHNPVLEICTLMMAYVVWNLAETSNPRATRVQAPFADHVVAAIAVGLAIAVLWAPTYRPWIAAFGVSPFMAACVFSLAASVDVRRHPLAFAVAFLWGAALAARPLIVLYPELGTSGFGTVYYACMLCKFGIATWVRANAVGAASPHGEPSARPTWPFFYRPSTG
jgi:hypothetical protein